MNPITVPLGRAQLAVYRYHLENPPLRSQKGGSKLHRREQLSMQLTFLRLAALCPHAGTLAESLTGVDGPKRSWTEFTPKFAAVINILHACLNVGQQVIIGSPFREFSSTLHTRLQEAGVTSLLLDGLISPAERELLVAEFKSRRYPILITGLKSMGEGHSFENCSNLILPACSWGFDENEHIHHIWRLNPSRPITIYPILTSGTIDQHIYKIYSEKSDAAFLTLDGRLFSEQKTDLDLEQLLAETIQIFQADATTFDEQLIVEEWDNRTSRILSLAEARFHEHHMQGETTDDLKLAVDSLKIPSPTQLSVDILRKHYAAGTYRQPTKASIHAKLARIRRRK